MHSQSAMEYLMTYGWSILIVAVILGALAYLGVFNPLYFAPKANPGSCQVFRPNGAGTSYDVNLLGVCNGEIPKYTAAFNLNSKSSGGGYQWSRVSLPQAQQIFGQSVYNGTITLWADPVYYPTGGTGAINCNGEETLISTKVYSGCCYADCSDTLAISLSDNSGDDPGNNVVMWSASGQNADLLFTNTIPLNRWSFLAMSFNKSGVYAYIDGSMVDNGVSPGEIEISSVIPPQLGDWYMVCNCESFSGYNGYLSDVQIYNASLDSNSIMALYEEGIGGAPIAIYKLDAWWPLNGDANDYSGNGNSGEPTNTIFSGSWISDYRAG